MTDGAAEARLTFEPVFVSESEIIIPLDRVPAKPPPAPFTPSVVPKKKRLIINIETLGLTPFDARIISVGYQDPNDMNGNPSVIMFDDEARMITALMNVIIDGGFNEWIGYNFSFDLRFIVVRAMKLGIPVKQFSDGSIYDLGQAMAQVKFEFVYNAQRMPSLSDVADFFWGFPKHISDLEMMKQYTLGNLEEVFRFTNEQIQRTFSLYWLFRGIIEVDFNAQTPGILSGIVNENTPNVDLTRSPLTIPAANPPETWLAKCPNDLSEREVPINQPFFICPIDNTRIERPR